MSELAVLSAQLHAYRDFEECVVLDLRWRVWGTSLDVDLDFIWRDDGVVRPSSEDRRIVSIRFFGVSEVHMVNDLTDVMVDGRASLGWGVGEIACLRVADAPRLVRTRLSLPSYRASFRREGYSWIEIAFTGWEFTESTQQARQSPLNLE